MVNNKNKEELENLTKVMDSAVDAMKLSQSSIDGMITPELVSLMSPAQSKIIAKSKQLISLGLKDPNKILEIQKEIADLMEVVKMEAEKENEAALNKIKS